MSFTVVFEPDTEQQVIEAFQRYGEQSFGLVGEFLRAVKQSEVIHIRKPFQY